MQNIQQISMDFSVHGIPPRVYGKQDDSGSRFVSISLYNSGAAIALESDALFAMRYKTAQGSYGLYDTLPDGTSAFSLSGNTVTAQLVDQIFSAPGRVECELRMIDSTSGISTWTFYVEVEGSNIGDALIPSDYINVFSNIAAAVAADADRAEAAASSIDTSALMRADEYDPNNVVRANGGISAYISSSTMALMRADEYDPSNVVLAAGGIPDFVSGAAIPSTQIGAAGGVAPLDTSRKLAVSYLPFSFETGSLSLSPDTPNPESSFDYLTMSGSYVKIGSNLLVNISITAKLPLGTEAPLLYFTCDGLPECHNAYCLVYDSYYRMCEMSMEGRSGDIMLRASEGDYLAEGMSVGYHATLCTTV